MRRATAINIAWGVGRSRQIARRAAPLDRARFRANLPAMNPRYGIIFDMDGVLIDSAALHFESWKQLAMENGLVADPVFFRETFGRTNRYILPLFFGRPLSDDELARFAERKEAIYRQLVGPRREALPGVKELITALFGEGWRIGIGSSAPRENVEHILDALALRPYVCAYTSAEDVAAGKPNPEVFIKAAGRMGMPPSRCVVCEDAVPGVEAALRAGMKCVAITTTNPAERLAHAHWVIDSFGEVTPSALAALIDAEVAPMPVEGPVA